RGAVRAGQGEKHRARLGLAREFPDERQFRTAFLHRNEVEHIGGNLLVKIEVREPGGAEQRGGAEDGPTQDLTAAESHALQRKNRWISSAVNAGPVLRGGATRISTRCRAERRSSMRRTTLPSP